jgi:peptidoglycan-associated lipoprotein
MPPIRLGHPYCRDAAAFSLALNHQRKIIKVAALLTGLRKVPSRLMERLINFGAARQKLPRSGLCATNGGTGMFDIRGISRGIRFAAVLAAALAIAACAQQNATGEAGAAATPGSQQDFVVNVGDRVFFQTDSTELTAQSRATLDKQAQWLNTYSQYSQFTIEGPADERGTREYNLALGARRAQVVRDYLISRGVAANRMRTISYGKERPVALCDDISCWSQNRRAVTVLNASS